MSISYTGHCALPPGEAQRRIDHLRTTRPDWYRDTHLLTDAEDLGPFGAAIARDFGIEARCVFTLHLLNNQWIEHSEPAVEFLYEIFGTKNLVVTYGLDSIRQPTRSYRGRDLG